MNPILVTGASGFFGGVLKRRLLAEGRTVVNLDLLPDPDGPQANLTSVQGDIRDTALLRRLFDDHRFGGVVHCAAKLAHDTVSDDDLWTSNVDGTRNIAQACLDHQVPSLVNISTNCLWAHNVGHPIAEEELPAPVELYGRSKLEAEVVLQPFGARFPVITIRCPTIIDEGRLGLLAILFEFIEDGKRVWVVGDGGNRYQFIYAQDLATACLQALQHRQTELFHIGADDVVSLREVYEAVIRDANLSSTASGKRRARVASLPKAPTLGAMKLAHRLGVSPLGPYHYRMIAEDFLFDTTRIRQRLGWQPTLSNADMMVRAFRYYRDRRADIHARDRAASAHSKAAPMGIIRLLKWLS